MVPCVRSVRVFKKRSSKKKNQNMRNVLIAKAIKSCLFKFEIFEMWISKMCCDRIICELIFLVQEALMIWLKEIEETALLPLTILSCVQQEILYINT